MTNLPPATSELRYDADYHRLKQHVIETTGLAYYADKDDDLSLPICRRLASLGLNRCDEYLGRLLDAREGDAELELLAASLTIGETFFFRHREIFHALRDRVLPELIEKNRLHRQLRIWSAGCAIGAETYSLSILLGREFGKQLADWDVTILGTDINRQFLTQAQRGEFGEWSFRSAPADLKATCFRQSAQGWTIRDEFRRGVSFQYHNLVQHPFPSLVNNLSAFDLILCRNVMIYFDQPTMQRLVNQFGECLVDQGWLLVGHAEPNVEMFRGFRTVNVPGAVLYQRGGSPQPTWEFAWTPPQLETAVDNRVQRAEPSPRLVAPVVSTTASPPQPARNPKPLKPELADIRPLLDRGAWETASDVCQKLATVERLNPRLHFYEAILAEQSGRHRDTEPALKRAIYLDRSFVLAHYYLGLAQQRQNSPTDAVRSFRNVLALLAAREAGELIADADGLTVGELQRLTAMHLELLEQP